jgi:hypothetical protein
MLSKHEPFQHCDRSLRKRHLEVNVPAPRVPYYGCLVRRISGYWEIPQYRRNARPDREPLRLLDIYVCGYLASCDLARIAGEPLLEALDNANDNNPLYEREDAAIRQW